MIELSYNWSEMKTYPDVEAYWAAHEKAVKEEVSEKLYHEWLRVTALAFRVRSIFAEVADTMPPALLHQMVQEIEDGLNTLGEKMCKAGYHSHHRQDDKTGQPDVQVIGPISGSTTQEFLRRIIEQSGNEELKKRFGLDEDD